MARKPLLLLGVLLLVGVWVAVTARPVPAGTAQISDYEYQVVRAYFDDPAMVAAVAQWKEPWEVNQEAGYLVIDVTPAEFQQLLNLGFRVEVDLALTEEINTPRVPLPEQGGGIPGYPCYRTVEETFESAVEMATNYPTLVSWSDIGDSWDKETAGGPAGYDMQVLRLTNQNIPGPKPVLYVFGAIHAREYTTAETVTRFAEYMLENYGTDPDVTWLMDHHQLDLALHANPDGRKIAETGQLWRKNTNNQDGCLTNYGVDLNRNFEFYWNQGGSSSACNSEIYHGSGPASEPETQALQDYAYAIFPDQREDDLNAAAPITSTGIFLDIHSYAQEILWPWGFTDNPPPNGTGMQTLARKMGFYSGYDATQSLYATSGTTKDFMYGEFGVPAYTIEIGTAFFQSCAYFESNVWPEMLPTLLYAAKASRYSYIIPAGPDSVNLSLSEVSVVSGDPVEVTATLDDTRYNNSTGAEPVQDISAAELYIDVPDWLPGATPIVMDPVDGSFDETVEEATVTIDTTGFSSGQYTLYVRGLDAAGNWGAYSAIYLEVIEASPTAGFLSNSPVAVGETAVFTNTSTGSNLTYQWDFGDGSPISTEENPAHVYTEAMTYTVVLTAANNLGTDVYTDTVVVFDSGVAPTASFTISPETIIAGREVQFTNTSTGTNLTYEWDFGDGSPTVTDADPLHVFMSPGTYTVTLTASNDLGSDSFQLTINVWAPVYLPAMINQ